MGRESKPWTNGQVINYTNRFDKKIIWTNIIPNQIKPKGEKMKTIIIMLNIISFQIGIILTLIGLALVGIIDNKIIPQVLEII